MMDWLFESCPRETRDAVDNFRGANTNIKKKRKKKKEKELPDTFAAVRACNPFWTEKVLIFNKNLPYPRACEFLRGKLSDQDGKRSRER
jgi:hypothetical protein